MEINTQPLDTFRTYAQTELEKHQRELQTSYQDRELSSDDLKEEAYRKQREVFEKELTKKIEELSSGEDQFLRSSLNKLKDDYVSKLSPASIP
jgi:predicted Holliday junction resolvase-like endonuclease